MFSTFEEFLSCIIEAKFTFSIIWQAIVTFFGDVVSNPDISAIWNGFLRAIEPIYTIVLVICIALALVMAFLGKKIIGVINFIAYFLVGFIIGTHLLAPLLPPEIDLPGWIIGVVLALILGVLSKFIAIAVYVVVSGYSVYILTYHGFFFTPNPPYSHTRAIIALVCAIVVIVLVIIFRKYFEMFGTAALGSWLAVIAFTGIYDFTAWSFLAGFEWLAILILTVIITAFAFTVQVKTRKRY